MSTEIAKAYIQLIPSAEGLTGSIESALSGTMEDVQKSVSSQANIIAGDAIQSMSAPLVKAFETVFNDAASFEAGLSEVMAISGATTEEMNMLSQAAMDAAKQSKFSTEQATEGLKYMAMAGWGAVEMANSLQPVMNLAGASATDLGTTSDILTDAMTALGYSAAETTTALGKDGLSYEMSNAAHFADVLAVASTSSNTDVAMLGESFKYAAATAGSMGYTVEDVSIALGLMANSGIKASNSGTALRTLMVNMAKPTADMSSAMEQLGVSLTDDEGNMLSLLDVMDQLRTGFGGGQLSAEEFTSKMNDLNAEYEAGKIDTEMYEYGVEQLTLAMYGAEGAQKAELAAMLAGKTGMAGLLSIINASDADYQRLIENIYHSAGATDEMYHVMNDNALGAIEELKSQLNVLTTSMGQSLLPAITDLVRGLINVVDGFNSMDPAAQKVIMTAGALVLALGPVGNTIGSVMKIAGSVGPMVSTITSVVTSSGGVIGGIVSTLSGGVTGLFSLIAANPVIAAIAGITAAVAGLGVFVYKHWDEIKAGAAAVGEWIGEKFQGAGEVIQKAFEGVSDFFVGLWENIKGVFSGVKDWFSQTFTAAKDAAVSAWASVKDGFSAAWQGIQGVFSGVTSWFATLFTGARTVAVSVWNGAAQQFAAVRDLILSVYTNVPAWFAEKFSQAKMAAASAWTNVTGAFQKALQAVQSVFVNVPAWFGSTFAKARDAAASAFNSARATFTKVWDNIKSCFRVGDALKWGKDLIANFINGIGAMVGKLWESVTNIAAGIKRLLGFSQPEEGPLSDFDTYAPDMMELFAEGVDKNADVVQDAVANAYDFGMAEQADGWAKAQEAAVTDALQNTLVNWEKYTGEYWYDTFGAGALSADIAYNIESGTSNKDLQDYLTSEYGLDVLDAIEAINAASWALYEPSEEQAKVADALAESAVDWSKYAGTGWYEMGKVDALVDDLLHNVVDLGSSAQDTAEYMSAEYGLDMGDAMEAVTAVNSYLNKTTDEYQEQLEISNLLKDSTIDWSKYAQEYWYTAHGQTDALVGDMLYNLRDIGSTAEETADYFHWEYNLDYADAAQAIDIVNGYLQQQTGYAGSVQSTVQGAGDEWTGYAADCAIAVTQSEAALGGLDLAVQASEATTEALSASVIDAGGSWADYALNCSTAVGESEVEIADFSGELTGLASIGDMVQEALTFDCQIDTNAAEVELQMQDLGLTVDGLKMGVDSMSGSLDIAGAEWTDYAVGAEVSAQSIGASLDEIDLSLTDSTVTAEQLSAALNMEPEMNMDPAIASLAEMGISMDDVSGAVAEAAAAMATVATSADTAMHQTADSFNIPLTEAQLLLPEYEAVGGNMSESVGNGFFGAIGSVVEKVRSWCAGVIDGIKSFFGISSPSTVMAEIGGFLVEGLLQGLSAAWTGVAEFFTGVWQGIVDGAATVVDGIGGAFNAAKEAVSEAWSNISELFAESWSAIQTVYEGAADWFGDTFTGAKEAVFSAWDNASEAFVNAWSNIQAVFADTATWFGERFAQARDAAATAFKSLTEQISGIRDSIQGAYENIHTWFGEKFSQARDAAAAAWENVTDKFHIALEKIQGVFTGAPDWFERTFASARDKAVSAWNNIKAKFQEVWTRIKEAFNLKEALQWGKDMIANFAQGILNGLGSVINAVTRAAKEVKDRLGFSEPDKGPLSNFHTFAPDMMELFASGILDNRRLIQDSLDKALELTTPRIDPAALEIEPQSATLGGIVAGDVSGGGVTYNFYSPKALDPVSALKEAKKASQRMAVAYA